MHSPLPDSTALEAGILEDERPTRFSMVQDNVRHLLRGSVLSSMRGSILISPPPRVARNRLQDPFDDAHVVSPIEQHDVHMAQERLESPISPMSPHDYGSLSPAMAITNPHGQLFPPLRIDKSHQNPAQLSGTTLNHPDSRPKSLTEFLRHKARIHHRDRPRKYVECRGRHLRRHQSRRRRLSHWLLCSISTIALCALVAIYITLFSTQENLPAAFHILFVLGIIFTLILFLHSVLRMCLFNRGHDSSARFYIVSKPRHQRHRRREHPRRRHDTKQEKHSAPNSSHGQNIPNEVCPDPNDVCPDPNDAHPMAGVQIPPQGWDSEVRAVTNPPPAYGKWRGSVRADPEQMDWRMLARSGVQTPVRLSPTYEEVAATPSEPLSSPPTYVTKQTPRGERGVPDSQHCSPYSRPEMVQAPHMGDTLA